MCAFVCKSESERGREEEREREIAQFGPEEDVYGLSHAKATIWL